MLTQFAPLILIMVVFYFKDKITKVGEQFFTVEIGRGVDVEVERNAIAAKTE